MKVIKTGVEYFKLSSGAFLVSLSDYNSVIIVLVDTFDTVYV